MRNRFFIQLFIFILLFTTWREVQIFIYSPTMGRISTPIPVFPKLQIELLQSKSPGISKDALKETVKSLLQYMSPELKDESWQADYLFLNLVESPEPEVIITLSLPPDRGILAVLQKQNNHYVLYYYLKDLLPLSKLNSISRPSSSDILVTREYLNEQLGSYSESYLVKLWEWRQKDLQVLWSEYSFWEINLLNTWHDPSVQERKWLKLTQSFTFYYQPSSSPGITVEGQQFLYTAPAENESLPAPQNFDIIQSRNIVENLTWNQEWQRFILHTGTLELPGHPSEKVAVLKDMDNYLESLIVQESKYRVINLQGKIFLAEKKYIQLDP